MAKSKKSHSVKWPDIFQEGVLVDLDISFWSGRKKLKLPELGVTPKDPKDKKRFEDLFSLGTKRLIPKDRIDKFQYLANKIRQTLDRFSLRFPIGKSRYVPENVLGELLAELTDLKEQFDAEVESFLEDYPDLRDEMLDKYEEHAAMIWDEHSERLPDKNGEMFLDRFLQPIEVAYPGKKKAQSMFGVDWHLFTIDAPVIPGVGEEQTEKINGFLDHVVLSLREEITQYVEHVTDMLENDKKFTERTMQALAKKIERFRKLNFLGDGHVDAQLKALEDQFLDGKDAKQYRGSTDQMNALTKALKKLSKSVTGAGPVEHPKYGKLGAVGARRFRKVTPDGADAD